MKYLQIIFILLLTWVVTVQKGFGQTTTNNVVYNIDNARAIYGLRQIDTAYKGALVEVQIEGTSSTKDIGFVSNGELDTNTLKTFCKDKNCHVKTWYDQSMSKNSQNMVQTYENLQPVIMSKTGGIVRKNSKPALYFKMQDSNQGTKQSYLKSEGGISLMSKLNDSTMQTQFTLLACMTAVAPFPELMIPISMSSNNTPAPFEIRGGEVLTGNSTYSSLENQVLQYSMRDYPDEPVVWSFTYTRNCHTADYGTDPGPALKVYANNTLVANTIQDTLNQKHSSICDAVNKKLYIGTRNDLVGQAKFGYHGYISEVLLFEDYLHPINKGLLATNDTLQKAIGNLIKYYGITRSFKSVIHEFNETFERNIPDQFGLNLISPNWEQNKEDNSWASYDASYSLRRLSSGYTGPALTIRRKEDNKLGDVLFDDVGVVSMSSTVLEKGTKKEYTLAEFCKSKCYVQTWYCQSGDDSLYLFQDFADAQPLIVNEGELTMYNGKASIYFPNPSSKIKPHLYTKAFQLNQAYYLNGNWQPADLYALDIYLAAGVTEDHSVNSFFSKSGASGENYKNSDQPCPGPFNVYNEYFSIGAGNCSEPHNHDRTKMKNPINKSTGFGIWEFEAYANYHNAGVFELYQNNLVATPYVNFNGQSNNESVGIQPKPPSPNPRNHRVRNLQGYLSKLYLGQNKTNSSYFTGYISEMFLTRHDNFDNQNYPFQPFLTNNMMGYYLGQGKNALSFNGGVQNYVSLGGPTDFYEKGGSYTKEAWVKWNGPVAGSDAYQIVSSKDFFAINNKGALYAKNHDDNDNKNSGTTTNQLIQGVWYHVALVYDAEKRAFSFFINGFYQTNVSQRGSPKASNSGQMYVGRKEKNYEKSIFNGEIDEVRVWNVARTKDQIMDYHNKILTKGDGLIAYYDFNNGVPNSDNRKETSLLNQADGMAGKRDGILVSFQLIGVTSNYKQSDILVME